MADNDNQDSKGLLSGLLDDDSAAEDESTNDTHPEEIDQDSPVATTFSNTEYLNFGTFTYHLRRDGRNATVCGLSIEERKFKSSSRKPDLLDPCKRCHGQENTAGNKEICERLRKSLAEKVDTIAPLESNPRTFSESEFIALIEEIPSTFQDYDPSIDDIRYQLSRAIEAIEYRPSDPSRFTKDELGALISALEGKGVIPNDPEIVIATNLGLVKKSPLSEFELQRRGGKGVNHIKLKEEDEVEFASLINPRDQIFCFTTKGQIHKIPGYEIPSQSREEAGVPMVDLLKLDDEERVIDLVSAENISNQEYIITATKDGYVKRSSTERFSNIRSTGIKATNLKDSELVGVSWSSGEDDILLSTARGQSIRFEESQIRDMGRTAKGVTGIEIASDDWLTDICVLDANFNGQIVTITKNGYGKRSSIGEYRVQNRSGKGLVDIDTGERNGHIVANGGITEDLNVVIVTAKGRAIRMQAEDISCVGRNTLGVIMIELNNDDSVATAIVTS